VARSASRDVRRIPVACSSMPPMIHIVANSDGEET
jgi:hypothetical protein